MGHYQGTGTNYGGRELDELREPVVHGLGPAGLSEAQAAWQKVSADLRQVGLYVETSMNHNASARQGAAADAAAAQGLSPLASYAQAAQIQADFAADATANQAEYYTTARNGMPNHMDRPSFWSDALTPWEYFRKKREYERRVDRATDLMYSYQSNSNANISGMPEFTRPQNTDIGMALPTGTQVNPGGPATTVPSQAGGTVPATTTPSGVGPGLGTAVPGPGPGSGTPGTLQPPGGTGPGGPGTPSVPGVPRPPGTPVPGGGGTRPTVPNPRPGVAGLPSGTGTSGPGRPGGPGSATGVPGGRAGTGGAAPGRPVGTGGGTSRLMPGNLGAGLGPGGNSPHRTAGHGPGGFGRGAGGEHGPAGRGGLRGGVGAGGSAFGPMGGSAGDEEDGEHRRPDYLVETEDVFRSGELVAPPVIGEVLPDYYHR